MGRLKHIHLVLILGISLFIPLSLFYCPFYCPCVDLSGTALLSSDMNFEDPEEKKLSTCQNELRFFAPKVSFNSLLSGTHSDSGSSFFLPPLTSHGQITPVLRC